MNDPAAESADRESVDEKTIKSKFDYDTIYVDVDEICDDGQKGGTRVPGERMQIFLQES